MYVVFTNPSGWPDYMKVRDRTQYFRRREKLQAKGYEIIELACFCTVDETWTFMLEAQRDYREARYGCRQLGHLPQVLQGGDRSPPGEAG